MVMWSDQQEAQFQYVLKYWDTLSRAGVIILTPYTSKGEAIKKKV
jgi:hypothetical protein